MEKSGLDERTVVEGAMSAPDRLSAPTEGPGRAFSFLWENVVGLELDFHIRGRMAGRTTVVCRSRRHPLRSCELHASDRRLASLSRSIPLASWAALPTPRNTPTFQSSHEYRLPRKTFLRHLPAIQRHGSNSLDGGFTIVVHRGYSPSIIG